MKSFLGSSRTQRHGAGAGSAYIIVSFGVSGILTFAFQSVSMKALGGPAGYAPIALLWSATFAIVQVLWIGGTQTLGRYIAERESRKEDWRPVISSVKRWQIVLLVAFVVVSALMSPLITNFVFDGDGWLTVAFIVAVAAYAPEYFRRGIFNGHRQPSRLGGQILAEAFGRLLIAAVLLGLGVGVVGPVIAILLAPIIGVLAIRPVPVDPPKHKGEPFSAGKAFRFTGPVLVCMACAQAFANGGPIIVSLLSGTRAQVGLFGAALILTRVPQYVISPAIGALLPHASRKLASEGVRSFERFIAQAIGIVILVGVSMVGGVWLLGEWGLKLFGGAKYEADQGMLVTLAMLAALYILCDLMNQALFARGLGRLAALAWVSSLPFAGICMAVLNMPILYRVSISLVIGVAIVAVLQATFYLLATRKGRHAGSGS